MSDASMLPYIAAMLERGDLAGAAQQIKPVLRDNPRNFDVLHVAGVIEMHSGGTDEAVRLLKRAVKIFNGSAEAFTHLGVALAERGLAQQAIIEFDRALKLNPDLIVAHYNRARALSACGARTSAISGYEKLLELVPAHADALNNLASCHLQMRSYGKAAETFASLRALNPDYDFATGSELYARMQLCDWDQFDALSAQVLADADAGKMTAYPFQLLALPSTPAQQLRAARNFIAKTHPQQPALAPARAYAHKKLRVAYVSGDFHEHATAWLTAGVFEQHDKSRFETFGISHGPDDGSKTRGRMKKAFDRFIDISGLNDADAANRLREMQIDIAVDLKGLTADARTDIFAKRPAPLQVAWLGYPGTSGMGYMDYVIADDCVIPAGAEGDFSEAVVRMPHCYQPNDSSRMIGTMPMQRSDYGLPEKSLVFCSFNNSFKITPDVFCIWMRLLQATPDSVIWLYASDETIQANLKREAQKHGVNPARLVFARHEEISRHLARHRLADLFLDTFHYNAHTTASDALWTGLPVLTCAGTAFAGRVAASLLHAVDLPDLVTHSAREYEAAALALAHDPARLCAMRQSLSKHRLSASLFDTARFCRALETAFEKMQAIKVEGGAATGFYVSVN